MAGLRKLQVARWARGRRRVSTPVSVLAVAVVAVTTVALTGAFTGALGIGSGATGQVLTRQQAAQRLLRTQATGSKDLSPGSSPAGVSVRRQSRPATGGGAQLQPAFTNVRVNDPSLDTHEPDQTTQSETSIAVAGSRVAVGYNDSQQTGLFLTAGSDLAGYSYSTVGDATITDGGTNPNTPEFVNLSAPWLASTRSGDMYYSELSFDLFNFNLDVAVAKSTDGGKTFGTPVPVFRPPFSVFYEGDKPALATGRDPAVKARDNLYAAWDDFSFNTVNGKFFAGLPVASSTDGGATWHLAYAKRFDLTNVRGCSFKQFIGATPIVNRADGTLYVVAERLMVNDPKCKGAPEQRSEWIFRSTDGGKTFGPGVRIAGVIGAVPDDLLFL